MKHGRDVRWPDGSRLAVNLVLNLEEGAERSIPNGDETREPASEAVYEPVGDRDLIQETVFEFGARVGAPRVVELLHRAEVPATVFACGRAVEQQPETVRACLAAGMDFAGHGYRWEPHEPLTEEEERHSIQRTREAIEQATGTPPRGWFTRPLPSPRTRRLLIEEGFEYDSDSLGEELPYRVDVEGHPHLVVPYTLDVNDTRFWKNGFHTGEDWLRYCLDALEYLAWESTDRGALLSIGLHGRIIGRPARAWALTRLLEHLTSRNDIWLCRRDDLVDHWVEAVEPTR
jgi:allantoinase